MKKVVVLAVVMIITMVQNSFAFMGEGGPRFPQHENIDFHTVFCWALLLVFCVILPIGLLLHKKYYARPTDVLLKQLEEE